MKMQKITTTKPLNQNKMVKTKIADWLFNFWHNNHTHYWVAFDPNSLKERCRYCKTFKSE